MNGDHDMSTCLHADGTRHGDEKTCARHLLDPPDPSTPRGPFIGGYILAAAIDRWRVQRGAVPTYDVLVERLRAHRIATGWTQQDVADRIGLTRASIANAEAGRQTVPGDVLLAWVRVLGGEIALLGVEDTDRG